MTREPCDDTATPPTVDPSASPFARQEIEALPLTKDEARTLREFIEEVDRERAAFAGRD